MLPLPCMLVCSFVCANRTRDRGCSKHPVFPAPSKFRRGQTKMQTSGDQRRENAKVCHRRTSYPPSRVLPWLTRVAPCSPLSRTLGAGFAGADGILDSVCARRSAGWQVGTKERSHAAEQRNGAQPAAGVFALLWSASYGTWCLSVAHKAKSRRSPTPRSARAWPCPRCRKAS